MGLIEDLFGSSEDESSDEPDHPPKPDDAGHNTKEVEYDVYETTFHYENGDTETLRTYGQYKNGADTVSYNMEFSASQSAFLEEPSYGFSTQTFSYRVLTREPVDEKIGTETWLLEWDLEYKKYTRWDDSFKEWSPRVRNVEYELVDGVDDGQN